MLDEATTLARLSLDAGRGLSVGRTAVDALNYIEGKHVAAAEWLDNVDPAAGAPYGRVASSDAADVERAVAAARRAFPAWSATPVAQRSRVLRAVARLIERDREQLARAEAVDGGKPIALASAVDVPRAAQNFDFFADAITQWHSEAHATDEVALNYTLRQPLGVVACISPWNLPLYLLTWKVAPALAAGNCVVAKPSEVTPMTAHMLGELCGEAGLPPGVLNIVQGLGPRAGAALVAHPGGAPGVRGGPGAPGRGRAWLAHRRPARSGDGAGIPGLAAALRQGDGMYRRGLAGGRARPLRRPAGARRGTLPRGVVRGAYRHRRPGPVLPDQPGGDLRTRRDPPAVRRHRPGGATRERHPVRPGRLRLDPGPLPRAPGGKSALPLRNRAARARLARDPRGEAARRRQRGEPRHRGAVPLGVRQRARGAGGGRLELGEAGRRDRVPDRPEAGLRRLQPDVGRALQGRAALPHDGGGHRAAHAHRHRAEVHRHRGVSHAGPQAAQLQALDRRAPPPAQAAGRQRADLGRRPRFHGHGGGRAELAQRLPRRRRRGVLLPDRRRHHAARARARQAAGHPHPRGGDLPVAPADPALAAAAAQHGGPGPRAAPPARRAGHLPLGLRPLRARVVPRVVPPDR